MANVLEYLDYRAFLHDSYEEYKKDKPYFSYRFIAGKVGINAGYVIKVFQSKVHLGAANIASFADLFKLSGKEREYFTELVHFCRAKSDVEIERRFERLQAIKGIRFRTVADDTVEFYRNWYHMAIRSLISICSLKVGDARKIAVMVSPSITTKEARDSLDLLTRLSLIGADEKGVLRVTEQYITTGERWSAPAIRDFQRKTIELAGQAIERHHKDLRDISTVTMTLALKDLPMLKERVKEFRKELLMLSNESTAEDCVMQLNMQIFPVALVSNGKEK